MTLNVVQGDTKVECGVGYSLMGLYSIVKCTNGPKSFPVAALPKGSAPLNVVSLLLYFGMQSMSMGTILKLNKLRLYSTDILIMAFWSVFSRLCVFHGMGLSKFDGLLGTWSSTVGFLMGITITIQLITVLTTTTATVGFKKSSLNTKVVQ